MARKKRVIHIAWNEWKPFIFLLETIYRRIYRSNCGFMNSAFFFYLHSAIRSPDSRQMWQQMWKICRRNKQNAKEKKSPTNNIYPYNGKHNAKENRLKNIERRGAGTFSDKQRVMSSVMRVANKHCININEYVYGRMYVASAHKMLYPIRTLMIISLQIRSYLSDYQFVRYCGCCHCHCLLHGILKMPTCRLFTIWIRYEWKEALHKINTKRIKWSRGATLKVKLSALMIVAKKKLEDDKMASTHTKIRWTHWINW